VKRGFTFFRVAGAKCTCVITIWPVAAIVPMLVALCCLRGPLPSASAYREESAARRWSAEQANAWYAQQPWLVGCNFIPSTAINQLEMWQAETFDLATIDRELSWAAGLGFNTVRVFLHDLAYAADPDGFKKRLDAFLAVAAKHRIRPMLVIFDDCWNQDPRPGPQPKPVPGVHNSGWVQSPGTKVVLDNQQWPRLRTYVQDLLRSFGQDERVLAWDLYNEPGNNGLREKSLPLLQAVFTWAWEVRPQQPLTAGLWFDCAPLNEFLLSASDVISFHNYNDAENLRRQIHELKKHGRPVVCTEYMARTRNSRFQTHFPIFREEKVGCYNWGLVSGKTQTIYPWGSPKGAPEPKLWFHDIFRSDGTPFDAEEVAFIRKMTGAAK